MTKKSNKKAPKGKSAKKAVRLRATGVALGAMGPYLRMLADPCGAPLAHPPYTGTDSGYLMRSRVTFQADNGTGSGTSADFFLQWTPAGAASNGFVRRADGDNTYTTVTKSDFLTSGVVAKARPVASCLKWVPTGPVTSRKGVVGLGYAQGQLVTAGATTTLVANLMNSCSMLSANGSTPHEVKWLPTIADEVFTNPAVSFDTEVSGGCVYVALLGVDATSGVPNGYFEATTIYEWTPAVNQGAAPAIAKASPFSTQQALSRIRDVGEFLFGDSMAAIGSAAREAAHGAVTTMLTGATYMASRRGGMLSL